MNPNLIDAHQNQSSNRVKMALKHLSVRPSQTKLKSPSTYISPSRTKFRPLSVFHLCQLLLGVFTYLSLSPSSVDCVRINSISPPQSFRNGEANSVILDCDFSLSPDDDLVVLKWFLNDEKQHIYQWIQSRDIRTYSHKIKKYVDETFVVSDHPTRHRALRLLNPPASLSGKYTCTVSSIVNEDNNSTHLVIYEPAKSFDIAAVEVDEDSPDEDGFNITCTAIGVYPEPEIKLYKVRSSINENLEATEVESNSTTVLSFRSVSDGFYSITLVSHIEQNKTTEVNSTTSSIEESDHLSPSRERLVWAKQNQTNVNNIAEHYECRLTIPNSDYIEEKRLAIQDGWRSKYRTNGAQSTTQIGHRLLVLCTTLLLVFGVRAFAVGHHRM